MITYSIDHESRTVHVELAGAVTAASYRAHVERLAAEGALGYARVVDARHANLVLKPDDIARSVELVTRLRREHGTARTGFVATGDALYGMARMYQMRNEEGDPGFAVFRRIEDALEWTRAEASAPH
jgi:hypothetical protein